MRIMSAKQKILLPCGFFSSTSSFNSARASHSFFPGLLDRYIASNPKAKTFALLRFTAAAIEVFIALGYIRMRSGPTQNMPYQCTGKPKKRSPRM